MYLSKINNAYTLPSLKATVTLTADRQREVL